MARILVIRGSVDNIKISNSVFSLIKPLDIDQGKITATVDASSLLGDKYTVTKISVIDYNLLD
jgi:hypothetical protein